jgi:glycosyltransferase involved in cell wall biosynthesis
LKKLSICLTFKNRAKLFRYNLEGLMRQDYLDGDGNELEICILDTGSTDNLFMIIDRFSEVDNVTFKYARAFESNCMLSSFSNPCIGLNTLIKYLPSCDNVIKTDAEVVLLDPWVLDVVYDALTEDDNKLYNIRTHFVEGEDWYENFDDLVERYERYYHIAEGGPFSRSKFYFFSAFNRLKFLELGGVDELFHAGVGYDDNCFREMWKNHYGSYEIEITGRAVHLWHGSNRFPPSWEELNKRIFNKIKHLDKANTLKLVNNELVPREEPLGCVEMLSKIYTIKQGTIVNEETPWGGATKINLPFA